MKDLLRFRNFAHSLEHSHKRSTMFSAPSQVVKSPRYQKSRHESQKVVTDSEKVDAERKKSPPSLKSKDDVSSTKH